MKCYERNKTSRTDKTFHHAKKAIPLNCQIFTDDRLPWLRLAGGAKPWPGQLPWLRSDDSLSRRTRDEE